MNTKHYECVECGKALSWSTRSDKKTCSANCRKRYSRSKKSAEKLCSKIAFLMNDLQRTLETKPHSVTPDALHAMRKLEMRISGLIGEHEGVKQFECCDCGQNYFGDKPPSECDYCQKVTQWKYAPI